MCDVVWQDVKFPMSLDVYELCNEGLQAKLVPQREQFKQLEDREAEEASKVRAYFNITFRHSDDNITLQHSI